MKEVNVLSFGAGVQSTTLALMSQNQAHGLPMFDFAVFADTGAEPDNVYQCLERIRESVDYPIITHMQKDGLLNGILENEKSSIVLAAFLHLLQIKTVKLACCAGNAPKNTSLMPSFQRFAINWATNQGKKSHTKSICSLAFRAMKCSE